MPTPHTVATTTRDQELAKLEKALAPAHLTLADARRILLPKDPWEAVRGLWKGRNVDGVKEQRRLRKELDRGY